MNRFLLAALFVLSASTGAQAQRSVRYGIGGGTSIPTGRFDFTRSSGGSGIVSLFSGFGNAPFGLRLDYQISHFTGRAVPALPAAVAIAPVTNYRDATVRSLTANAVVALPVSSLKTYLLVGGGWYTHPDTTNARVNDVGVNGGVGGRFPIFCGRGLRRGAIPSGVRQGALAPLRTVDGRDPSIEERPGRRSPHERHRSADGRR